MRDCSSRTWYCWSGLEDSGDSRTVSSIPIEPGRKPGVGAECGQCPIDLDKHILDYILHIVAVAHDGTNRRKRQRVMPLDKLPESLLTASQ
jgi:hypothetical protein